MKRCNHRSWLLPAGTVRRCQAPADVLLTFRLTPDSATQTREFCDPHAADWLEAMQMDTLNELTITDIDTELQPQLADNRG